MFLPTLFLLAAMSQTAPVEQPQDQLDLDFLVGSWEIEDANGQLIGTAEIVAQVPHTMLYEQRTIGDGPAQSLWLENAERNDGWTQLFVGPVGQTRQFVPWSLPGEWPLVLGADITLQDGTPVRFRMTLSHESNDASRRHLEISRDGGHSWETVFDYLYRRAVED